jgi:hypothetical protein
MPITRGPGGPARLSWASMYCWSSALSAPSDRRIRPAPSVQAEIRGSYTHPTVADVASPLLSSISDAKSKPLPKSKIARNAQLSWAFRPLNSPTRFHEEPEKGPSHYGQGGTLSIQPPSPPLNLTPSTRCLLQQQQTAQSGPEPMRGHLAAARSHRIDHDRAWLHDRADARLGRVTANRGQQRR